MSFRQQFHKSAIPGGLTAGRKWYDRTQNTLKTWILDVLGLVWFRNASQSLIGNNHKNVTNLTRVQGHCRKTEWDRVDQAHQSTGLRTAVIRTKTPSERFSFAQARLWWTYLTEADSSICSGASGNIIRNSKMGGVCQQRKQQRLLEFGRCSIIFVPFKLH